MTKVLIVDDKAEERYLLETLLKGSGYEVVSANNGEEALKKLRSDSFDLILSDILMPVMDGFKLCMEVRGDKTFRNTPFIFQTATYLDERDEELGLKLGADSYIKKPIEPEDLIKVIQDVLKELDRKKIREVPVLPEEEEILTLYNERLVKKLEKRNLELQKLEQRYRTLCENVNDLIFALNEEGYFTDANCKTEMFGYTLEDLIGRHFTEFLTPQSRQIAISYFEKAQKGENRRDLYEVEVIKKDGGIAEVELSMSTIYEGEKFMGRYGVARDITERRRMEKALRQSEERYRELFENVPVGIYRTTPEGEIVDANPAMVQMLGYPNVESLITAKAVSTYAIPEDRRKWQEIMDREGEVRSYEKQLCCRDGTVIWVQEDGRAIRDASGRVIYYEGAMEDITKRKGAEREMAALQEQLRQSQKMEAIGQLAGGIAHDFNNLLTIIQGNCELSSFDLREGDPLKANIEEIRKASHRAAGLTRQLLAFSRRQVMEMKVFDLSSTLRDLEKMLRRVIGEDIELIMTLSRDLGTVKADPGQIEQVVVNLSVNARDAMPKGGKLTIETTNVELDEEYARAHIAVKPGRYVMLSVSDTGVGMAPEVIDRIFEPFFTTKEMGRGTGLGLSTVYGIVKQSGGNVWVYSEPEKGSTFKIYLPRVDEPPQRLEEKRIEALPQGNETVLVVEDDETVRKLAVRILKRQGYQVFGASEGGEALLICEQQKGMIHLIVTDVVMPGMSGSELVKRLNQLHPEMKALYMSGYPDDAVVRHGVLEKGLHYVQKPFSVESLAKKVREALDKT